MSKHIVSTGQDLMDVTLQRYGSLDYFFNLFQDNSNLQINTDLASKDEITFFNTDKGIVNVRDKFEKDNFIVCNSDEDTLGAPIGDWNDDYNNDYNN